MRLTGPGPLFEEEVDISQVIFLFQKRLFWKERWKEVIDDEKRLLLFFNSKSKISTQTNKQTNKLQARS
jgi:hypothetical protein